MPQAATLANVIVAAIPPALVFFLAYGRYDGAFKDNVVFIYFIGGLILGGFLGFLSILAFSTPAVLAAIVLLSLIYPVAVLVGLNRRKWQGERHAIFNGGALGLGVAVMLGFTYLFVRLKEFSLANVGVGLLFALGLAGIFFGMGLLAGNGVRLRKPYRMSLLGTAIFLGPLVFIAEFVAQPTWLMASLLAAYGAVFAVAAERRLMAQGLTDESRRQRRRQRRGAEQP